MKGRPVSRPAIVRRLIAPGRPEPGRPSRGAAGAASFCPGRGPRRSTPGRAAPLPAVRQDGRLDAAGLFKGVGRSTFCAFKQHFLPDGEWVKATLIYRDGMGKEQRLACELKERC